MYRCELIFFVVDAINQWTRINKITVEGEFVGLRCHAVNFEVENKIWNMKLKIQPRHFFFEMQEKFKTSRLNYRTFFVISSHTAGVRCAVRSLLLGPKRNGSVSLTKLSIFSFYTFFFKLVYYLAYSLTVNNKKNSSGKESQPRKRKTKIN